MGWFSANENGFLVIKRKNLAIIIKKTQPA